MSRLVYEPSPSHKVETTAAGPPKWNPYKERCPVNLGISERESLLAESASRSDDDIDPRRWAVRRTRSGLELYESKLTREMPDGSIVVHGHPTRRVPPPVLRLWRDRGKISAAEYNRLRKEVC